MSEGSTLRCPACGSSVSGTALTLPPVPVHVGTLWTDRDAAMSCTRGAIEISVCGECGYVWNAVFDESVMQYELDYDNSLHHSPKFAEWEQSHARRLIERHELNGRRLAEIGCGDGRFLAMLCRLGDNTGIGFEPGHNPARVSELVADTDVTILDEFADAGSLLGRRIDFAIARHVLEHFPEPTALTAAIADGLRDDGALYVEVPNFAWALERGGFEDLMYEHCGYYTPVTLGELFRRQGFTDIRCSASFDGLFASVEARPPSPDRSPGIAAIEEIEIGEIRAAITRLGERLARLSSELSDRRKEGRSLIAWGGGARAVGLLNLVDADGSIEAVVDVNPRKQGTFVAGTGHPIVEPASLATTRPDDVLIVNPIYKDEIASMLRDLGVQANLITI